MTRGKDELTRLGKCLSFGNGKTPMLDDAGPYPVYGSNGVIGHSIAFNQESSIILGRVGAYCGSVNYEAGKYWSTDNTIVVNATKENDTLFFQYLLRSYPLNSLAGGSAQPLINHKTISRIQAWVPPLATQRKIAAILTAYDDLIEINKRRIDVLEKMAEEIYREWFVRMRFPGYQNTKITKGVPEGWERKKFGEFCMLKRGYDLPNDLLEEGPYPVVASTSVKAFHKHYKVEPPVITTGRSGSLGDVLMTHTRAWPLNTALYVRNFFGNSPFLVFYTLKNMGLEKFDSGAGVPTLNRNHVSGIPMVVPERSLQQRFDGIVAPIHQQVETLRQENTNLTKTRDLLLPRLISGKLSVADLDIQFPPSMREDGKGQGGGDAPS